MQLESVQVVAVRRYNHYMVQKWFVTGLHQSKLHCSAWRCHPFQLQFDLHF